MSRRPLVIAVSILAAIVAIAGAYRYIDRHRTVAQQYADLDAQRAAQKAAPKSAAAPQPSAIPDYWTDFRGPARDGHRESMGGDGPRATPTYHEDRVYALGAAGDLQCLDAATGTPVWTKNILRDAGASNLQWGMSGAPLIVDDKVIVQPGGRHGASIVAYDKTTGATVWKTLNDQGAYTSPMLVTIAGRRQILTVTATRAVGVAPENGALLWDFPWENSAQINVAQPILVDDHRVLLSAAYGAGAALVEVTSSDAGFKTRQIWANSLMKNRFQTSVLQDGYVYGLDEGILTCLDVNAGERKWKGGRYGYGQVLLASEHLIVQTEDGELVLVAASPDRFNELARVEALHGRSWNVPAFADGRLLVRNATEMAAYDLRK